MKKKVTRESQGVAFVLFIDRTSAQKAVQIMNNRVLFGRTLKCNIAKDNGRTTEFIKRKIYKDKSFCYECGVRLVYVHVCMCNYVCVYVCTCMYVLYK